MINMKGLKEIVLAGALALGIAGCSNEYVGNDGYSCEKTNILGTIVATKGDAKVTYSTNTFPYGNDRMVMDNMDKYEAVKAIDGCLYAFKKLDKEKSDK